jgi:hypothetical protein
MIKFKLLILSFFVLLTGCVTAPKVDYSAFRQSHPKSILVLPPLNNTNDIRASASVLSTVTTPIAEAGYYVFPVAVVDQTFKENGLHNAGEIHQTSLEKLQKIFGADAVLYLTVEKYGAVYRVLLSDVTVTVKGELVDARTGVSLWKGSASASSSENQQNGGGLVGILVSAAINQMVNSIGDSSYPIARMASNRLFTSPAGLLYGPRSPLYGTDTK